MKAAWLIVLAPIAFGAPALAQTMSQSMPGMSMPMTAAKPAPKAAHRQQPHRRKRRVRHPLPSPSRARSHADHDMAGMKAPPAQNPSDMAGMPGMKTPPAQNASDMASMPGMTGMDMSSPMPATAESVGNEPAPPPITDHAGDRVFDPSAMAAARAQLHREHGGEAWSMAMFNLAEYQANGHGGGYRWDGEASFGGDINRLFLKSEGEGASRSGVDSAEVQALYSRAFSPTFDFQAGVRQDLNPGPKRTYATVGIEGVTPYEFQVDGAVFLSTHGEWLGRLEGYHDYRVTQRWILQPRAEINLAAQSVRETGIGSGVSNLEFGLRLRYEIRREFAPYIGVSYDRKFGATADFARARGDGVGGPIAVVGIRTWF